MKLGEATRFKPGVVTNPNGRPSKQAIMRELVEKEFAEWMAVYQKARDSGDQRLALDAAERIFDRVWGKAVQPIQVAPLITDAPGGMLDVVE